MIQAPTQIAGIKAYLEAGHAITPSVALTNFQCFRLAARVKELKERFGLDILTTIKTNPVSGNRYASYSLDAKAPAEFVKGDRVEVVSVEVGDFYREGDRGTVVTLDGGAYVLIQFDEPCTRGGGRWWTLPRELKVIS